MWPSLCCGHGNRYVSSAILSVGIGIPKDKQDKVFEVFHQADGSTTRKYGGTGLGLAICKQISRLMGGDVWLESEFGKGSIFHFVCWVDKSKKEKEKELAHDFMEGKKVLIIDDNLTNLRILSHSLELEKMEVTKTSNSKKVISIILEKFKQNHLFDTCIIDIQMPEISGYDIAREIRKLESPMSEIPLLALSSSTLSRSKKFKESGFNGFLLKPIRRIKMLKMIERLLGKPGIIKEKVDKEEMVTQHTIIEDYKHSINILLAEDNLINQKLARFMLEKSGYKVTVANNGEEAVNIYKSTPDKFNLILMDIQMPKLDGKKATGILRNEGFNNIPIIAMTAEVMKGDREKCIAAGMNDYIPKPIKRDVIFKVIKKWCFDK